MYLFCQIISKSDMHANDLYKLYFGDIEEMNRAGRTAMQLVIPDSNRERKVSLEGTRRTKPQSHFLSLLYIINHVKMPNKRLGLVNTFQVEQINLYISNTFMIHSHLLPVLFNLSLLNS